MKKSASGHRKVSLQIPAQLLHTVVQVYIPTAISLLRGISAKLVDLLLLETHPLAFFPAETAFRKDSTALEF